MYLHVNNNKLANNIPVNLNTRGNLSCSFLTRNSKTSFASGNVFLQLFNNII